jgi:hypothetical protein
MRFALSLRRCNEVVSLELIEVVRQTSSHDLEFQRTAFRKDCMIYDLPTTFPGLEESPLVTKLVFPESGVAIEGTFRLNEFALLPPEQLEFLRLYIKVRGNLKEVERVMGISYPTVRARFDAMLRRLGYEADPDDDTRNDVLRALEKGDLSADEALERLKKV